MFHFSSYARNGPGVNKNLLLKLVVVGTCSVCFCVPFLPKYEKSIGERYSVIPTLPEL